MAAGWGSNAWGQTGWGRSLYDASVSEVAAFADSAGAALVLPAAVVETVSLGDEFKFVHLAAVSESVSLDDVVRANATWAESVAEGFVLTDATTRRLLWEPIDDTQDPGWTLINTRP